MVDLDVLGVDFPLHLKNILPPPLLFVLLDLLYLVVGLLIVDPERDSASYYVSEMPRMCCFIEDIGF